MFFFWLFLYFPILILLLLLKILKPFVWVRFGILPSNRLGHFVRNMDIYFCYKKKKYLDIFCINEFVCNYFFLKKIKKKINVFPRFIILLFVFFIKKFSYKIKFLDDHFIKLERDYEYDYKNILYLKESFFKFTRNEIDEGEKFLRKIGIEQNDKYVCLCVRDSSYLKKTFPEKNFDYHNYRDHDLNNFYPMMRSLNDLGYKVIRMGKYSDKVLKTNNNKMIIDYASIKNKSDMLDFYLFYKCKFCITTSTGMEAPAVLFRKPILQNTVPFHFFETNRENIVNFTKHHYSTKLKRNLKFSELSNFYKDINQDISNGENFFKNNIQLIDNSPKEWNDYTIEFINCIINKTSKIDYELQNFFWLNFKNLFKDNLQTISNKSGQKKFISNYIINKEKIGKISAEFLKCNPEWLE